MSNSPLVCCTKLSPNYTKGRTHTIDTISIHCMAGDMSVESCGAWMAKTSTGASSNYGVGSDGRIGLYVEEKNRSWCTSNAANDNRAVTIEVANSGGAPDWPVSEQAYAALLALLVDICRRNSIKRLLWKGDKALIGQVDKQNMTVHRWFAAKACPGDYLYSRHAAIAAEVNRRLEELESEEERMITQEQFNQMMDAYLEQQARKQPGAWSEKARQWAESRGIVTGDSTGSKRYKTLPTKEEVVQMLYNLSKGG